jgi:hypothetical protein
LLLPDVIRNKFLVIPNQVICNAHLFQIITPGFSPIGVDGVQRRKLRMSAFETSSRHAVVS